MPEPRLLVDNDALLKAAHWGVLDLIPDAAGCTWPEVACLPQFPPRVRRAEAKLFADPAVAAEVAARLSETGLLPAPDLQTLRDLQGDPAIDAGEQLLVGVLAATPQAQLLTGDKRAMIALARHGIEMLRGRFICVEQLLWHSLDRLGAHVLLGGIRRWPSRDQAVLAVFGREGGKSELEIREGLRSYVRALESSAPGLLSRRLVFQDL